MISCIKYSYQFNLENIFTMHTLFLNAWPQLTLIFFISINLSFANSKQVDYIFGREFTFQIFIFFVVVQLGPIHTGDPLHSRAACTQPCNVNTHSRAHCSPGARLCEQWGHGCVNNGARLCASARLCRGSPVIPRDSCGFTASLICYTLLICIIHVGPPLYNGYRLIHTYTLSLKPTRGLIPKTPYCLYNVGTGEPIN